MEEADFRTSSLQAFKRHGYEYAANESEADDFFLVCVGLNSFLSVCASPVDLPPRSVPLTLGDKVRIGEFLIAAMREANCKLDISPHQISLCDWKALKPVIDTMATLAEEVKIQRDLFQPSPQVSSPISTQAQLYCTTMESSGITREMIAELEAIVAGQQVELDDKVEALEQVTRELEGLNPEPSSTEEDSSKVDEILDLVEELDFLKLAEKEFKATCRWERDRLQARVQEAQAQGEFLAHDLLPKLEHSQASISTLLAKTKSSFAGTARVEAKQSRQKDEEITPGERAQYEMRFSELFDEMSALSDVHRKEVAVFNSHATKLELVKGQINLLTSIRDGFGRSRADQDSFDSFTRQFPGVLSEFDASLGRSRENLQGVKEVKRQLDEELLGLIAKQREHYERMRERSVVT